MVYLCIDSTGGQVIISLVMVYLCIDSTGGQVIVSLVMVISVGAGVVTTSQHHGSNLEILARIIKPFLKN